MYPGFYTICLALLSFVFLICSFRTNGVFVIVFASATLGFSLFSGAAWNLALGNVERGVISWLVPAVVSSQRQWQAGISPLCNHDGVGGYAVWGACVRSQHSY